MAEDQFNHLLNKDARNGRLIRENGETINQADSLFLEAQGNSVANVFRGRGYIWQHTRESIPQGDVYYYAFTVPSDKYAVVYTRALEVGQGPVRLESVIGATFDPGTVINPTNLYTGGPASGLIAQAGVTNVQGGVTIPNDFIFGAGKKVGVAGESKLPTIVGPDIVFLLKVTNEGSGTNPGIRIAITFTEIPVLEFGG